MERPRSLDELADRYKESLEAHLRDRKSNPGPSLGDHIEIAFSMWGHSAAKYIMDIDLELRDFFVGSGSPCHLLGEYWKTIPPKIFIKHFNVICDSIGMRLPSPGERLGKHTLGDIVGVGGMGIVYRVRDDSLLVQDWAIKVILPTGGDGENGRLLERFRNEARLTAKLNRAFHGRFLTIIELEESNGYAFYRMDYIEGSRSLESEVRSNGGPLENPTAARLLRECAEAMRDAHSLKILHRDLKAANVLLTGDGHARVTDFGLAKEVGSGEDEGGVQPPPAGQSAIAGTLATMPPEQLGGVSDYRSDVYGLGAIGYFILTGRQPFQADSEGKLLELVLGDRTPADPTKLHARVDARLARIVMKCLEKDPEQRYSGAEELVFQLRNYEEDVSDKPIPIFFTFGIPLLGVISLLAAYLIGFGGSSSDPTVLSDIIAYQYKTPAEVWKPLTIEDIEDVPDPDYGGFEIRVDSRFWDLSLWHRSLSPEWDPELSYMTRVVEVRRRPGHPANRLLPFHFRTSGRSINPRCSLVVDDLGRVYNDPRFQSVQRGKRLKLLADGSRVMTAYQLLIDLAKFPEDAPIKVVIHAIYVNSFQGKETEFMTARVDVPVETAQLSALFPRSMTFSEFELFEHPGGPDRPRQNAKKLGMPRADPDAGMFGWTIRQKAGVNAYDFEWTWKARN